MSFPDLERQSLAVDFVENQLGRFHPVFAGTASRYDPERDAFVAATTMPSFLVQEPSYQMPPQLEIQGLDGHSLDESETAVQEMPGLPPRPLPEPAAAMKFWDDIFPKAMAKFKAKVPSEPRKRTEAGFSIRSKTGWIAVYDQLDRAEKAYVSKVGFKGKTRKIYRKLAEKAAPAGTAALGLVPDSDYITPVRGALLAVLKAAKFAADTRQEILQRSSCIDQRFSEIELFIETFPRDENLVEASVSLVAAALAAVELVIGFYTQHLRMFKAFWDGEGYQMEIKDCLKKVETAGEELIHQASMSKFYDDRQRLEDIRQKLYQWQNAVDSIKASQEEIKRGQTQMQMNQHRLETKVNDIGLMAQNFFYNFAQAFLDSYANMALWPRNASPVPFLLAAPQLTPHDLLQLLSIPDVASADVAYIQSKRQMWVAAEELARAENLVQERRVKEWLMAPASMQLLVHGGYDDPRAISGLSLFCAALVEVFSSQAPAVICLSFFCGRHADMDESEAATTGARAMAKTFICQLLAQHHSDTTRLAEEVSEQRLRQGDLLELCRLLRWLLFQLPAGTTVFWFIDGAEFYERDVFLDDFKTVVMAALEISGGRSTRAWIKVLLTTPTRTMECRRPFEAADLILHLQARPGVHPVPSMERVQRLLREESIC